MSAYSKYMDASKTPQTSPIPGREADMVANSAGGFAFAVDDWSRLDRFILLGSESGSYYATEQRLTLENAAVVNRCLALDAARTVKTIVDISVAGRAPKNSPAVFALALAAKDHLAEVIAQDALTKVARIPTDLFAFVDTVSKLRGWGRSLRNLIVRWYTCKTPDNLGYLVTKYQQRAGWSHKDVLRLIHAKTDESSIDAVFRWAVAGKDGMGARSIGRGKTRDSQIVQKEYSAVSNLPEIITAFEEAKVSTDKATICRLIRERGLVREHIPTQFLNEIEVWEALLEKMPLHALLRNLGKMTSIGLIKPLSNATASIAAKLADGDHIHRSRLHPMAILIASKVYGAGKGVKGSLTWNPSREVVDALDAAFYLGFANVTPTGKRRLLAIDVSGSMGASAAGSTLLTCREAAAAVALIAAKTDPRCHMVAFSNGNATSPQNGMAAGLYFDQNSGLYIFSNGSPQTPKQTKTRSKVSGIVPLDLSGKSRLSEIESALNMPFDATDCSLPMKYATAERIETDSFEIYTDSETFASAPHPAVALKNYRKEFGIPAKMVVQAFASNGFTIADPKDAGMLDVVGLDAAAPAFVADFIRGAASKVEETGSED